MERSNKRGKIPQRDWPSIIKRYEAGETLASIARTYDCSPPAISYIVSRRRARDGGAEVAPSAIIGPSEPQLVKGRASETHEPPILDGGPDVSETSTDEPIAETADRLTSLPTDQPQIQQRSAPHHSGEALQPQRDVMMREGNGATNRQDQIEREDEFKDLRGPSHAFDPDTGGGPHSGEPRRTLHLSISQNGVQPLGTSHQDMVGVRLAAPGEVPAITPTRGEQEASPKPVRQSANHSPATNGGPTRWATEVPKLKEGSAFIDQTLRERVASDISAFLAAFDAALAHDTPESRAGLRDATDRLLRAGARTRIELERLEARLPLPSRDNHPASAWRPR